MAAAFEDMVKADELFELVTVRQFSLVCFRLRPPPEKLGGEKEANELKRTLLEEVNATSLGPYMSSAKVGGIYMLRCAVGSTLTEERHVKGTLAFLLENSCSDSSTFILETLNLQNSSIAVLLTSYKHTSK
jgi:aromatic-L-amino-acid/L-tryptophan decarboxylase